MDGWNDVTRLYDVEVERIRQAARTVRKFLAQGPSIIEAQAARNAAQ